MIIQRNLDEGMTEAEVERTLGASPDKVESETCGQNSEGGSWKCRTWTYYDYRHEHALVLMFQKMDNVWRLNSWFSH